MKVKLLKLLIPTILILFPVFSYSATITGATICVNGDDATDLWINGNSIGTFNYVNWDSASLVPCMSVPVGYLNAAGTNVIAAKVRDTAGGQVWSSWTMDVIYSDGTHAYVSSNDGGIKLSPLFDCTTPPNDAGSLAWYASSYALHSSWGNAVGVTGQIWGKTMFDIGLGKRISAWSYSVDASAGGHGCLFMRQGVTFVPETPPGPPNFTITKSASKTSNIDANEAITFTLIICNTGGYTTNPVYIIDDWLTNQFGYNSTNSSNNSNSSYGPNFSSANNTVRIDFPGGFEGNGSCVSMWFTLQDYSWQVTDPLDNCAVRQNGATVYWNNGSNSKAAIPVSLAMKCFSPTFTPTRTYTSSATRTKTPSPTYSRTFTPSLTMTYTLTRTNTAISSRTFTSTLTATPTITSSNSRTPTPSYTPSFTVTYSRTSTRTATPSVTISSINTATNTPTHTPTFTVTPSPTNTRTATPTFTVSFTQTMTFTRTVTPTITITTMDTPSNTLTRTGTFTPTPTYTVTMTSSPTFTRTVTPTITITTMNTPTVTPTNTPTYTASPTRSAIGTYTETATYTPTYTATATRTVTPTMTITSINTATVTPSVTPTVTLTPTPSPTFTDTRTYTRTATQTNTRTFTLTVTPTITFSPMPMCAPALLTIDITNRGDNPAAGSILTYRIKIRNDDTTAAGNLRVWDTLPPVLSYLETSSAGAVTVSGNYIVWDLPAGLVLNPGEEIFVVFTAALSYIEEGLLVINAASADYNDGCYNTPAFRHPAITSDQSFYPEGQIVVFPNPFSPESAIGGTLKFANMVPGALLQIYTVSGELVHAVDIGHNVKYYWGCKNRYGKTVSPGIYYWVVKNPINNKTNTGKIFIIR